MWEEGEDPLGYEQVLSYTEERSYGGVSYVSLEAGTLSITWLCIVIRDG